MRKEIFFDIIILCTYLFILYFINVLVCLCISCIISRSTKQDQVVYTGPVKDDINNLESIGPEVITTLTVLRFFFSFFLNAFLLSVVVTEIKRMTMTMTNQMKRKYLKELMRIHILSPFRLRVVNPKSK